MTITGSNPVFSKKKIMRREDEMSPRAKRALTEVAKGGTKADALRKAGYSNAVVRTPGKVFDRPIVKSSLDKVIAAMEKERDEAIKRMAKVRGKAKYRDLTDAVDKMTKNAQLLSGGKTSNDGSQEIVESLNNLINKFK